MRHNTAILRKSSCERVRVGDLILVKEADTKLAPEKTHNQLAHEALDGKVTAMKQSGLSYKAMLSGRQGRNRAVSAATTVTTTHEPLQSLHFAFKGEFAHLGWGADLWLAGTSTMAAPLHSHEPAGHRRLRKRVERAISRAVPTWGGVGVTAGGRGAGQLYPATTGRLLHRGECTRVNNAVPGRQRHRRRASATTTCG